MSWSWAFYGKHGERATKYATVCGHRRGYAWTLILAGFYASIFVLVYTLTAYLFLVHVFAFCGRRKVSSICHSLGFRSL